VKTTTMARGLAATLVTVTLLSACGGGDDPKADETTTTTEATTTTTLDPAAEQDEVGALVTTFFRLAGEGDLEGAAAMIENGEAALPRLIHCADLVKGVTVEVKSVELTDAEHATVLYDILKDGAVLLAGSGGGAVKVDSGWLVSENTFLSLYDAAKDSCTGTPPPAG
jgi:nitrogenase subunit NifH